MSKLGYPPEEGAASLASSTPILIKVSKEGAYTAEVAKCIVSRGSARWNIWKAHIPGGDNGLSTLDSQRRHITVGDYVKEFLAK